MTPWGWVLICMGCASAGACIGALAIALAVAAKWPRP